MKRNVLAVTLGLAMMTTFMPAMAEEAPAQESALVKMEQNTSDSVQTPDPTKAPDPTEAPVEENAAPETQAPDQEEPAESPTEAPAEFPENEPFTAKVKIELENQGPIYFGDKVTLNAVVEQANADYTVIWEFYNVEADVENGENPWVAFERGEICVFIANEKNAELTYRVVVNDTVISNTYNLPKVEARPAEDAGNEPDTEPDPEPQATHPVIEEVPMPTLAPDLAGRENNEASKKDEFNSELEDETAADPDEETEVGNEPELNPDRSIAIRVEYEGDAPSIGEEVTLVAELTGYDNAVYDLQWQTSKDNETWSDVEGATELRHAMTVTEENCLDYWRMIVTVTGIQMEAAE